MANTRPNSKWKGYDNEDQEIPPQGNQALPQVPNYPQVGNVTLKEFWTSMNFFCASLDGPR